MSNYAWLNRRYKWTETKKARVNKDYDKRVRIAKSLTILNGLGWQRELLIISVKPLIHNGRKF